MLRVTGLCAGNSPMAGEFLAQRASNAENSYAENVSIWWRLHVIDRGIKGPQHISYSYIVHATDIHKGIEPAINAEL